MYISQGILHGYIILFLITLHKHMTEFALFRMVLAKINTLKTSDFIAPTLCRQDKWQCVAALSAKIQFVAAVC